MTTALEMVFVESFYFIFIQTLTQHIEYSASKQLPPIKI